MSKLVIIRGNSASGKSTVADKLRLEMGYGTMLIPQDVVRRNIIRVKDTPDNPSIQLIYDIAMYGERIGYNVIVEGILSKKTYGDMLHKLIANFNSHFVYYFDLSFEETLKRHDSKPQKNVYSEDTLRSWWLEKDYLSSTNEKCITDTMSVDEIVKLMINEISE